MIENFQACRVDILSSLASQTLLGQINLLFRNWVKTVGSFEPLGG